MVSGKRSGEPCAAAFTAIPPRGVACGKAESAGAVIVSRCLQLLLERLVAAHRAVPVEQLVRERVVGDEIRHDLDAARAAAEPELAALLVTGPAAAPPSLVVGGRIDDGTVQVDGACPIAMLKLAILVEIGQAIEDKVPANEIYQVPRLLIVLYENVMTRQFRQSESACHLSPPPSGPGPELHSRFRSVRANT